MIVDAHRGKILLHFAIIENNWEYYYVNYISSFNVEQTVYFSLKVINCCRFQSSNKLFLRKHNI